MIYFGEESMFVTTNVEFNERMTKNIKIIVKELPGKRLDDTDKFLKAIMDVISWEIQVVNGTVEVLNEGTERVNKEDLTRGYLKGIVSAQMKVYGG